MANRLHQRNVINAISIDNTSIGEYYAGDDGAKFRKFPGDAQPPTGAAATAKSVQLESEYASTDQPSSRYDASKLVPCSLVVIQPVSVEEYVWPSVPSAQLLMTV